MHIKIPTKHEKLVEFPPKISPLTECCPQESICSNNTFCNANWPNRTFSQRNTAVLYILYIKQKNKKETLQLNIVSRFTKQHLGSTLDKPATSCLPKKPANIYVCVHALNGLSIQRNLYRFDYRGAWADLHIFHTLIQNSDSAHDSAGARFSCVSATQTRRLTPIFLTVLFFYFFSP